MSQYIIMELWVRNKSSIPQNSNRTGSVHAVDQFKQTWMKAWGICVDVAELRHQLYAHKPPDSN